MTILILIESSAQLSLKKDNKPDIVLQNQWIGQSLLYNELKIVGGIIK